MQVEINKNALIKEKVLVKEEKISSILNNFLTKSNHLKKKKKHLIRTGSNEES